MCPRGENGYDPTSHLSHAELSVVLCTEIRNGASVFAEPSALPPLGYL